jgi:predicted transcriptional regulator
VTRGRGELERAVMGVLWARDEPATARTVLRELGDPDLAYATVKTVLERLTGKGVATRVNVERTWHYSPTRSRASPG